MSLELSMIILLFLLLGTLCVLYWEIGTRWALGEVMLTLVVTLWGLWLGRLALVVMAAAYLLVLRASFVLDPLLMLEFLSLPVIVIWALVPNLEKYLKGFVKPLPVARGLAISLSLVLCLLSSLTVFALGAFLWIC